MKVLCFTLMMPAIILTLSSCTKRIEPGSSVPAIEEDSSIRRVTESPIFLAWDTPPELIEIVPPEYPRKALKDSTEGYVDLVVVIDDSGKVVEAEVFQSQPPGLFESSAKMAVLQWRYKPAMQRDLPITVRTTQRVTFSITKK